jgi:energy-coupling factor transporter ATP-binding protein EcfA2
VRFFSFVAWYSQIKRARQNVILLLDEPGLTLHGRAQGDLLRYFEKELKEHHQVIYSTHSPFMVDPLHFERVRIVQDLSIDREDLPREQQGTKVRTFSKRPTTASFPCKEHSGTTFIKPFLLGQTVSLSKALPIFFSSRRCPRSLVARAKKLSATNGFSLLLEDQGAYRPLYVC